MSRLCIIDYVYLDIIASLLAHGVAERVSMSLFFQAEGGIRDLVRSRGLGDVYKRQVKGGDGGALLDLMIPATYSPEWIAANQAVLTMRLSLIHI